MASVTGPWGTRGWLQVEVDASTWWGMFALGWSVRDRLSSHAADNTKRRQVFSEPGNTGACGGGVRVLCPWPPELFTEARRYDVQSVKNQRKLMREQASNHSTQLFTCQYINPDALRYRTVTVRMLAGNSVPATVAAKRSSICNKQQLA